MSAHNNQLWDARADWIGKANKCRRQVGSQPLGSLAVGPLLTYTVNTMAVCILNFRVFNNTENDASKFFFFLPFRVTPNLLISGL